MKRTPYRYTIGAGVILLLGIAAATHFMNEAPPAPAAASETSRVTLASVARLSSDSSALPVTGKVSSLHQATILAQSAGAVTAVYASIGSHVGAGQVIAKLENSSQYAAVEQAQGAYDAAQASYAKASGTTAQNTSASAAQAAASVENARIAAAAALQSAYAALDDAVHTKADTLFSNPTGTNPQIIGFTSPDSQLVITAQNERIAINATLADARARAADASAGAIDANIAAMQADTQAVIALLTDLVKLVNTAVPNQTIGASAIAGYQATISAARSEALGNVSALAAAKSAYDNASSTASTASNTASGGTASDIAISKAGVEQALGALHAAQSNLEKTVIRSPITGTIVNFSIKQGDFVTAFSPVAIVSNASALEVITHVTPSDAKTLTVGDKAMIDGSVSGVIVSVAPALDPANGKIEVKIGITGNQSALTDGDTVAVSLGRATTAPGKQPGASKAPVQIPIEAVKVTPSGPVVFTVASSSLVAINVELGPILGQRVTILSGLTPETDIVTDARGLSEGQAVEVNSQ